jgi:DNA repair protein RadC
MSLQHWPETERPREKLLKLGAASLSEAELLAILLQTGTPGRSALDMARGLLGEFRSLRGLLTAERHAVCRVRGLGAAKYALLQASLELSRRHYAEQMQMGPALANPRATREFLRARLRDRDHEVFCCLFLDNRHRVISFDEVLRGTIDGASVHPREVVKLALARNAAAVILAHNHPSGSPSPARRTSSSPAGFARRWRWWTSGCWTTSSSPATRPSRLPSAGCCRRRKGGQGPDFSL